MSRQKDKKQRPKRGFNIVMSGQFRTLAMFSLKYMKLNRHSLSYEGNSEKFEFLSNISLSVKFLECLSLTNSCCDFNYGQGMMMMVIVMILTL